jgi:hypothetical protein
MNDRKREILCDATNSVPHLRVDAASANARKGNGGRVRDPAITNLNLLRTARMAAMRAATAASRQGGQRLVWAVLVDETDHDIWGSDLAFAGLGVDVGSAQKTRFAKSGPSSIIQWYNRP